MCGEFHSNGFQLRIKDCEKHRALTPWMVLAASVTVAVSMERKNATFESEFVYLLLDRPSFQMPTKQKRNIEKHLSFLELSFLS